MHSLQAVAKQLKEQGVRVLGVSRDSVKDQAKFAETCDLDFALLSDADGSVTEKFDCAIKGIPFSQRVTFIIDDEGKVRLRESKISVRTHGADMIKALKDLQN